ncbi:MAG: hypothetical protein PHW27_07350 [Melioribacteraceae bacterium]|nr:hypothetical protein [Melioribacteraceae bacterium]
MVLRIKILSGFFILALMLSIAGFWSIKELRSIGTSVQNLLDENYKSINSAKVMLEALEREDSGILLLMLGKWEEGRKIISAGDSLFQLGYNIASSNITIENEKSYIEKISKDYFLYKQTWERPIVGTDREGNITWYFDKPHKQFMSVKESVNKLMNLNDKTMFDTASELQNRANRAVMPGIVAIIAAVIFSLIFTYFINYFMISPIVKITNSVTAFVTEGKNYNVEIESKDEISRLSDSIRTLCEFVKTAERKN